MEIGIIGLAQSGKSTLFQVMTGVKSSEIFGEPCIRGVAAVPDQRFDRLVEIFSPAKVSPARVPFIDVNAAGESTWDSIRQSLTTADAFVHVIDAFTASDVSEVTARYRKLADELAFSDLVIVENRLERLKRIPKQSHGFEETVHAAVLPRAKEHLEAGKPLRAMAMSDDERHMLRGFAFWTLRPELVVVNVRDDNLSFAEAFAKEGAAASPVIGINCMLEGEIAELPPHERQSFLEPMGIAEPAFERIIRAAFELLGRIRYFTVGEDEVKAWLIPQGSSAPRAAAAIHKDFERGFIKAEVVSYDDFIACGGTLSGAKAAGKQRLEGKDYIVKDGDIISFRFNV